jgi:hypothetical protein
VEELLAERGVQVDHVTVYRWVQRLTPLSPTLPGRCGTLSETGSSPAPTPEPGAGRGDHRQGRPYLQVFDELVPAAAHVTASR